MSAGREGGSSAFGSGSSVLSQWEPPPLEGDERALALANLLDGTAACEGNLEELEAVINKLQAIYLYRQGLKALTEESLGAAFMGPGASTGSASASFASQFSSTDMTSTSFSGSSSGRAGQTFRQDPAPSTVPGSANSIWRMNSGPGVGSHFASSQVQQMPRAPTPGAQFPGVVSTQDLASLARLQYQLYQDTLRRYKKSRHSRGQKHCQRRKPKRQPTAPVLLRAPQWADSTWHPMTAVLAKGNSAGSGTGVFIPPSKSGASDDARGSFSASEENLGPASAY